MQPLKQQGIELPDRLSLVCGEVPNDTHKMNGQECQSMVVRQKVLSDVAVVAICANENRSIRERAVRKVRPDAALDVLDSGQFLALLHVDAVC